MSDFKFGQIVLVRGHEGQEWVAQHYSHCNNDDKDGCMHVVFGGDCYAECKSYEGNEALLGRTGNSVDQLDYVPRKKPKIKHPEHYDYLERVMVKRRNGTWEPGVYIDYSEPEDSPNELCHYIVTDSDREPDWYRDCCVRKKMKENSNGQV